MKNLFYLAILTISILVQNSVAEDSSNTGKKVLGSILVVAGLGGLVYESGKEIDTDDSGQTKILGALSIVGGIALFQSANKKTTVQFGALPRATVVSMQYKF